MGLRSIDPIFNQKLNSVSSIFAQSIVDYTYGSWTPNPVCNFIHTGMLSVAYAVETKNNSSWKMYYQVDIKDYIYQLGIPTTCQFFVVSTLRLT